MGSQTDIKKGILSRAKRLYWFFFTVGIFILLKILYIQYGPEASELRARAVKITYREEAVPADRGDILASDGRLLATSVPTYEIRMDFAAKGIVDSIFRKEVGGLAESLSKMFGNRSSAQYKNILLSYRKKSSSNRYTLISPRRISYLEMVEASKFPFFKRGKNKSGVIFVQVNKRVLPHGSMASRTIGMVNESGTKLGIEGAFDEELRGVDGRSLMQKVVGNFWMPVPSDINTEPVNGLDVVTTIDVDIQDVAEKALREQLEYGGADWGTAILMEVATGEIKAMTNLTRKGDRCVEDFNYAIGMNLEPGSTFKLASLITLIDDAGMKLTDTIDTGNGEVWIGKAKVVDTKKGGYGKLSLKEIFEKSSNVGFARAVNKHYAKNPSKFVDNVCRIGVDKPVDFQIAGEQKPVVRHPGNKWWDGTTLTMMSYGYAVRMTPIHILTLYNAVANNGKMISPVIVRELRQYGNTVRRYKTNELSSSICSSSSLEKVRECLEGVVDDGTARMLKNPYYKVAGKTGTAQIAQGSRGYSVNGGKHYLATLVGYFPADNPKYTCIVAIKTFRRDGSNTLYYGGSLSGPVFRAIADRVYAKSKDLHKPIKVDNNAETLVAVKAGKGEDVREVLNALDIPFKGKVKGWSEVSRDTSQNRLNLLPLETDNTTMANVCGMGLRDAVSLLGSYGMVVKFNGVGKVYSQSPSAGAKIKRGETAVITLR